MTSLSTRLSAAALAVLTLAAAGCGAEAKTPASSSLDSASTGPDGAASDTAASLADTATASTGDAASDATDAADTADTAASLDASPDTSLADTATASNSDAATADTATASDTAAADTAADVTAAALGSPCSAPADCGSALFCLIPFNSSAGTCVAYHTEGETCMIDDIPCISGLICTNGAVCYKPKTNAQVGESCHYDKCAPDLICVGLPQVAQCQAKAEEGAPCTGALPAGCKAGLVCGPDGKCVKK